MSDGRPVWPPVDHPHPLMRCGLGSVRAPRAARGHPLVPGLEPRAKPAVVDPQIAVTTTADRVRPYRLHLLGHHADIDLIAPIVLKAIQADAVGHRAKPHEIVLEPDRSTQSLTDSLRRIRMASTI